MERDANQTRIELERESLALCLESYPRCWARRRARESLGSEVDPDVLIEWAEWEGLLALPFELPLSVL